MREFENLVKRTHRAGLKMVIDFVPNHVARQYFSDARPKGVRDLGEDDDTSKGFDPENNFPLQYYLFGLLTALCFMAIAQFVRAAMGSSGLVVLVVLLMLQLCTAAGTFPIESELPVFNVLNPLLPMTYVVQGFRMAMCGLDPSYMASSAVVLGGFTLTFLVLSTLLAHHRRRISMSVLHPKIQMVH